jgi:hypothetical protein
MLCDELEGIIRKGEGQTTDFKASAIFSDPLKLAKLMVAFANNLHVSTVYGGLILIGVNDNGSLEGIKAKQGHEEHIMNIARDKCYPPIAPKFETIDVGGSDVYVVTIPKMKKFPHALRLSDCNAYYIRVGTTVRVANPEELQELFVSSGKTTINQIIQRVRESIPAYSGPYRSVLIAPEYLTKNMIELTKENELRIAESFDRALVVGDSVPTQNSIIFRLPNDKAAEYFATVTQEGVIFYREAIHESIGSVLGADSIGLHLDLTLNVIKKMMEFAKKVYEISNYKDPCSLNFEAGNIQNCPLITGSFNRPFYKFESGNILSIVRELSTSELSSPNVILEAVAIELCRSFGFHITMQHAKRLIDQLH